MPMATIYDTSHSEIGEVDYSGYVTNRRGSTVGKVHSAGGGGVDDDRERYAGQVSSSGQVSDTEGRGVGRVSGTSVYDETGYNVGSVRAETTTTYVTGITEAHKAGAALLLLLLKPG